MVTLVTDRKIVDGEIVKKIADLSKSTIDQVIIREKDLNESDFYELYCKIMKSVKKGTLVIPNTDEKIILKYNLECFHLSKRNFDLIDKKILNNKYFGVSVHSVDEAIDALRYNPKYLLVSHIFETNCKKNLPPKGIKLLKLIRDITNVKIIALGGINFINKKELSNIGFEHVAMRSELLK